MKQDIKWICSNIKTRIAQSLYFLNTGFRFFWLAGRNFYWLDTEYATLQYVQKIRE
jgi:hypothetical protein